ncbi:uncharacterized protein F5891DRAFT_980077 [Suillus fuscotomentosus]|uniref:Uncharacterized protein n=1 Tax=Suillus fuscotomentosus TaxID=1912939 RepID=A0AAD4E746_9AGAM|nr:uncharacterized protein F5891DRAFT_980077 [Suillus fuscotomentosus]KAG1900876.1 hypothetical protein F5891DRAFT_980077 [Suillus fuscotomentosus]
MASRATSEPVAHGQEGKGKVLYVGGDDRETLLKGLRNRAFNRRKLSPQREVVRESRKVVYAVKQNGFVESFSHTDLADETGLPPVSDDGQHPSFHERPFLKGTGTGKTRWFRSSSAHQLLCPNEDVAGAVGDLYVYTNIRSRITYIWVMHPVEGWVSITAGGNHPTVPNRRLRIRKDGDPSWVQIRSLISMESRERRR